MNKLENKELQEQIEYLLKLETNSPELKSLFNYANTLKQEYRGNKVYFRGLIEISNICAKNCYYCGIRRGNANVSRYELSVEEVIKEAQFALDAGYGSIVIQGGERSDVKFLSKITGLIIKIKALRRSDGLFPNLSLGVTLSLGEQKRYIYGEWYNAGAHRYLLRVESSNREFYGKMHPNDALHSYDTRVQAIRDLKEIGFKTGTGVMIGVPGQTIKDLANDLMFFKEMGVGMVGMGPYIAHSETPMGQWKSLFTNEQKLDLSLKMVAILRVLMPNINIAATTALQVLDTNARERAVLCGANVIMPNVTDILVKGNYNLYEGKPGVDDGAEATKSNLVSNLSAIGVEVGWNEWGD